MKRQVEANEKPERTTIFHQFLNPEFMKEIPTVEQLKDEAYIVVAAAADTTGNAMTTGLYNTVSSPRIYAAVTAELREAFPDPNGDIDFVTLEKLPYFVRHHPLFFSFILFSFEHTADSRYNEI